MVQIISPEEVLKLNREFKETQQTGLRILSPDEVAGVKSGMSPLDLSPSSRNPTSTIGAYLKAIPATAVDITLGAGEGFASAIGEFTGDYDLARSIGAFRDDVNDAIMGDTPDDLQSDFAYKLASGLGSTLPYLGAAIVTKNPSLIGRVAAGSFFLSSAGQQVRDDYLASQGVTSEDATDEQMSESNKAGAIGAIPIALAERLGAGLILKPFAKGVIPAGQVMERITQYAAAGAGEALTEATQSGLINYIASYVSKYDQNRPITAGMAESALIGFLVGGGVNATVDTVNRRITQADRLKAGVQDGSINPKDVIDPDIGSKLTEVAMENDAIPEADTDQQKRITDPTEWRNFVSKTLTPLSRRLGRAGKEIVREFRKYEMDTGIRTNELKKRIANFQTSIQNLKKTNPEDYRALSLALANSSELATSLPNSTKRSLEKKAQLQPEINLSQSERVMAEVNPNAGLINEQIAKARDALAQRGLNTKIEIAEEGTSMYDPTTNTIVISAEQADGSTVAHEFFHAVLGQAVKTDAELQSMTRNMFDSVIRASVEGSSINEQLKTFVSQYDENIQNEEFLAQTVGELARQYQTLDLNTKTRIKVWINQAMRVLGIDNVFKQAETDAEVINQLNAFARFAGQPEALTESMGVSQANQFDSEEITPLGEPVRGTKFQQIDFGQIPDNVFPSKPHPLSLITDKNMVDIQAIMDDVINNNKTVAFFAADQLGVGKKGNYTLDGGPSFALTKDGVFWMSGSKDKVDQSTTMDQYAKADYIFVFSGSPTMHTFNKSVFNGLAKTIKSKYKSYEGFKEAFIGAAAESSDEKGVPVGGKDTLNIINFLEANDSFDQLRDEGLQSPSVKNAVPRKDLLKLIDKLTNAKKDSPMRELALGLNLNLDSLRDGFYVENDYGWLDLMMIGKPDGKTVKGDFHSTYGDQFMGETLGVPNKRVNLKELLSAEEYNKLVEKYVAVKRASLQKRRDKNMTPEAVEERRIKFENEVSKLVYLQGNPDAQRAKVIQKELDYVANLEYTEAKEDADYALAEEPQTSIADKINYNAGGMKIYAAKQLRKLRDEKKNGRITEEQFESASRAIREQKARPASDMERMRGISDEGLRIMQKHGMVSSYTEVRNVLEQLKDEYQSLGLDMNYIDNYFPRLMQDLDGFKKSIGQTVGIDEEIRRYENMTGQKLTTLERQKMYEKLARSRLYRGGLSEPSNLKERRISALDESQLQYYADPESALDEYISRMVQTIETKKLIGDAQSGKTRGKEQVAGRLGEVMERMASQGRLRQDQIEVIQGAVSARFGQHGRQYGFVKGVKNAGYLATMGNIGSAITQIGDFYFTAVQNGVIPTMQALVGSKALTIEDLGIAKDMVTVETKDGQGFLGKSVDTVFKLTGLTAMDRLAKNTNINATYKSLQKGAKANPNSNKYKKTVNRLKRIQGNDAFKTISDLKNGVKSDLVVEAIYNELSDIAPISLTEMPEAYASNPNLRILYSLKSYTIKQLNFVREMAFNKMMSGVASGNPKEFAEGSVNMMKILVFGAVANGSADVLKAILFNREIDEEDFWWNHILRLFGVTKYTTVTARKEGVGTAITKTILPPQAGILNDIFKDIGKVTSEEGLKINDMRSMKYIPVAGKIYYWREGKGVDVEEKLSRLREKD
jgi:hypothetical protein